MCECVCVGGEGGRGMYGTDSQLTMCPAHSMITVVTENLVCTSGVEEQCTVSKME